MKSLFGLTRILAIVFVFAFTAACEEKEGKVASNAEQAAAIKEDIIKGFETIYGKSLSYDSLSVEPVEGNEKYHVSIKGVKLDPTPETKIVVGDIGYTLLLQDEKTFAIADLEWPAEISITTLRNVTFKLTMNPKAYSGLWSRELGAILSLNAEFEDIKVSAEGKGSDAEKVKFDAQSLKMTLDSKDRSSGILDQTHNIILSDIVIANKVTIDEIAFKSAGEGIKIKELREASRAINELARTQAEAVEAGKRMSEEDQKKIVDSLVTLFSSMKNVDYVISIAEFKFPGTAEDLEIDLDRFEIAAKLLNLDGDQSGFSLGLSHEGFDLKGKGYDTPVTEAFLPRQGNLLIEASNVPTRKLLEVGAKEWQKSLGSKLPPKAAFAGLVGNLQSILTEAGIKIRLAPSRIEGNVMAIDGEGAFDIDPKVGYGATGAIDLALHGLDAAQELVSAHPEDANSNGILAFSNMLVLMANREMGKDGKPIDRFRIEVTPEGRLLVNGKPMGM